MLTIKQIEPIVVQDSSKPTGISGKIEGENTVFVLLTRNLIPFVVKITSHNLSSSIYSMVSASLLSLLYFSIIPSSVEVNNEYHVVCPPSLTEKRAVVVFVEFLMRNRDW